jgi:hypothetical protein
MAPPRTSIKSKQRIRAKQRWAAARPTRPKRVGPGAVPLPLPLASMNLQDDIVVDMLSRAELGSLPVDRFADLLREEAPDAQNRVAIFRQGLIKVYGEAANRRRSAKASYPQIHAAQITLRSLTSDIERLDRIKPPRQRGLQAVFGGPADDYKGADELSDFASNCWKVKLNLTKIAQELERAISLETAKPSKAGDHKKRLRTLIEALAHWWRLNVGKQLAPYVYAKRGEGVPAFVVGRKGKFIELATALFCGVDHFKESEVVSAVTNVHEADWMQRDKFR